jgi:Domain of unknown function (DUF4194)
MSSADPPVLPPDSEIPRFLLQHPPGEAGDDSDRQALSWMRSDRGKTRTSEPSKAMPQAIAIEPVTPEGDIERDENADVPADDALFQGDTGRLKGETRRTLVQLLSGPSVDGRRQPQLWSVLLRDRRDIASRLNELFLELVVDAEQRVAFVRQAGGSDDDDLPILLRRQPLTFIESALVLHLRQRLTEADRADERAVIGTQEMLDHLAVFEKASNNDGAKFDKQCQAAIEKIKSLSVLRQIRGSEGRFEVSPTLKLLFSAEEVIALGAAYEALKSEPERDLEAVISRALRAGEESVVDEGVADDES